LSFTALLGERVLAPEQCRVEKVENRADYEILKKAQQYLQENAQQIIQHGLLLLVSISCAKGALHSQCCGSGLLDAEQTVQRAADNADEQVGEIPEHSNEQRVEELIKQHAHTSFLLTAFTKHISVPTLPAAPEHVAGSHTVCPGR
jgi:hypothetical protein